MRIIEDQETIWRSWSFPYEALLFCPSPPKSFVKKNVFVEIPWPPLKILSAPPISFSRGGNLRLPAASTCSRCTLWCSSTLAFQHRASSVNAKMYQNVLSALPILKPVFVEVSRATCRCNILLHFFLLLAFLLLRFGMQLPESDLMIFIKIMIAFLLWLRSHERWASLPSQAIGATGIIGLCRLCPISWCWALPALPSGWAPSMCAHWIWNFPGSIWIYLWTKIAGCPSTFRSGTCWFAPRTPWTPLWSWRWLPSIFRFARIVLFHFLTWEVWSLWARILGCSWLGSYFYLLTRCHWSHERLARALWICDCPREDCGHGCSHRCCLCHNDSRARAHPAISQLHTIATVQW